MSTRITIRLPDDLYARLLLFAHGRSHGQTPDVSVIVREALEECLTPVKRQTQPPSVRHQKERQAHGEE